MPFNPEAKPSYLGGGGTQPQLPGNSDTRQTLPGGTALAPQDSEAAVRPNVGFVPGSFENNVGQGLSTSTVIPSQQGTGWNDGGPGGAVAATPNWTASKILTFTPQTSQTLVLMSGIASNGTAAQHSLTWGVAAVAKGAAPPTAPDYKIAGGPYSSAAHTVIQTALSVLYGGSSADAPAALAQGQAFDFYVLFQADAGLAFTVAFQGAQLVVRDA